MEILDPSHLQGNALSLQRLTPDFLGLDSKIQHYEVNAIYQRQSTGVSWSIKCHYWQIPVDAHVKFLPSNSTERIQ